MSTGTLLTCLYLADGNIYLLNSAVSSRLANSTGEPIGTSGEAAKVDVDASVPVATPHLKFSHVARCPPPSRAFTGREDILEQMQDYFFGASPMDRRLFVLCGLGGAGKTQLALKFVQTHRTK